MARLSAECYAMSKYSAKTQCQWEDIPVIQDPWKFKELLMSLGESPKFRTSIRDLDD